LSNPASPPAKQGVAYFNYSCLSLNYFVINPDDFIVKLRRNQSVTNKINPVASGAVDSRFVKITDNTPQYSMASDFIKKDNSGFGLEIFTFYYADANIARWGKAVIRLSIRADTTWRRPLRL
jgi:hypothetical protein